MRETQFEALLNINKNPMSNNFHHLIDKNRKHISESDHES